MHKPGLKLTFLLFAWLLACPSAHAALQGQPTSRVVRQYAITSANDFPQRDPQDWRLLGSNDGGQTWTTLDVRKGEIFSERHQRRLFQLTNPRPFNTYRLQIDRVRDPAAGECVQISEIEPLGTTADDLEPAPLMEDLITAQEDNPPFETSRHAFDGRVETKWLDRAARNPTTRASWVQWQYTSPADLVITNVNRLLTLANRASRSYAVRIQGFVAGPVSGSSSDAHSRASALCFFDGANSLRVPQPAGATRFFPGQRILLEGRTQWTNGAVELADRSLTSLGGKAPNAPRQISAEQLLPPQDSMQWSRAEGNIRFCSWAEDHWVFELEDNARSLSVHVLLSDPSRRPPPSGSRVSVQGLCAPLFNDRGQSVAALLWVPGLEAIRPVKPVVGTPQSALSQPSAVPLPPEAAPVLTTIPDIRHLTPEELLRSPKVKVRGVVTELLGAFIQEGAAGVEVWYPGPLAFETPALASFVEIEGRGSWAEGHGPIIRAEKVIVLGKGKLPEPEHATWSQLASGRLVGKWVEIEAVVRSTDGSHLLVNTEGGQLMATIREAPAPAVRRLVDASVRIRGVCVPATDSRGRMQGIQLLVPSLEWVEISKAPVAPFSLPARPIGSLLQVRAAGDHIHRVRVEGILTFHEDRTLFVQDATGGAMAIAQQDVILSTPASGWNWMFQQSPNTSPPGEQLQFKPGDHLQIVGFPEMRGYSPVLTEVLIRKTNRGGEAPVSVSGTPVATQARSSNSTPLTIEPVRATVETILQGGLDATLVTLEGTVLRKQTVARHFVLELQSGQHVFQAYMPLRVSSALDVPPGTRVRVTGVCQVEPAPYPELGRRVASFKLLVGSLRDFTILERPPWLTLRRAIIGAAALLLVLAIATAWIGLLHSQVRQRTRQLRQEIEEHEKTEALLAEETRRVHAEIQERKRLEAEAEKGHKQLLKASRDAGMAEVATSVLHNVGNVLNSANVLGSSILEHVQRSKTPSVTRLANLLDEHRSDLGRFVTEDNRGQSLPGYLGRLGSHLQKEQDQLLEKTKSLAESLQHIKEIVAMQQNYARVSGVLETVSLAEILEDALRMQQEALGRHEVQIVRDIQHVPPVTIDRHKVLQILFNLLENAKHACEDSGRPDRQVKVSLRSRAPNPNPEITNPQIATIEIAICDNGVGIPHENLTRIFLQEFSTRKGGHGFGLHSSLLTAQNLGATLTAHSQGPGHGATFILSIPLRELKLEKPSLPSSF